MKNILHKLRLRFQKKRHWYIIRHVVKDADCRELLNHTSEVGTLEMGGIIDRRAMKKLSKPIHERFTPETWKNIRPRKGQSLVYAIEIVTYLGYFDYNKFSKSNKQ